MVTEDAVVMPRTRAALPYGVRAAVTLALLALYHFAHRVPLPGVDAERLPMALPYGVSLDLLALGLTPLLTGFILVELFAVVTSPGRRLRRGGVEGRAKLNRAALGVGLLLAVVQAWSFGLGLEAMPEPLVESPGLGFRLLLTLTLTAVAAALFVLGNLISTYGIGNGFALLVGLDAVLAFVNQDFHLEEMEPVYQAAGLLLWLVFAGALVRWFLATGRTYTPAFPQGAQPVAMVASYAVVLASSGLHKATFLDSSWGRTTVYPVLYLLAVALVSWITYLLFSTRRRIASELPETDPVLDELAAVLRRRLPAATALLAGGVAAVSLWQHLGLRVRLGAAVLQVALLVAVVAIALDVFEQYRFLRRNPDAMRLAQLDDVHFAYRLAERMAEEGIDAVARGLRFRSLYFFFGALYKVDLLVPASDLDAARAVQAELESVREVKAF